MAGDYQDYIRNIGIYPMWGIFCDFTFQGHGAMWTTEKGDVHNKNEVSTRAIATSMGFRESRPSNGVFFFLLGPQFFSLMDPWYFLAPTGASAVERKNTHWFRWAGRALEIFHRPGSVAATAHQGAFLAPGVERWGPSYLWFMWHFKIFSGYPSRSIGSEFPRPGNK